MLSAVIKHKFCRTWRLIFYGVNGTDLSFETDLLAAITANKSLKCLYFLGGIWTQNFLTRVISIIQMENPRINEINIEKVEHPEKIRETLTISTGRLLGDYFNYSVPGLSELSLHGLCLRDCDIGALVQGLEVNSSIKSIQLSLNLIEEMGFRKIFQSIVNNKKSAITNVDFSCNFIAAGPKSYKLLDSWRPTSEKHNLQVFLLHNPLRHSYEPNKGNYQNLKVIQSSGNQQKQRSTLLIPGSSNGNKARVDTTNLPPLAATISSNRLGPPTAPIARQPLLLSMK